MTYSMMAFIVLVVIFVLAAAGTRVKSRTLLDGRRETRIFLWGDLILSYKGSYEHEH